MKSPMNFCPGEESSSVRVVLGMIVDEEQDIYNDCHQVGM
jgi:hypothetical protein